MADVFGADVYQFGVRNSACLGAALRAWHADQLASGDPLPWTAIVAGIAEPKPETRVRPTAGHVEIYRRLRLEYAGFEAAALAIPAQC
jgi:sugar (pentulose or hexulose) kinase